jgi:hypothetical protein
MTDMTAVRLIDVGGAPFSRPERWGFVPGCRRRSAASKHKLGGRDPRDTKRGFAQHLVAS